MEFVSIFGKARLATEEVLRDNGELTINIPALPRPTLSELQAQFPWIRSIERDTSPETPVTLTLVTVLKPGEKPIDGKEYERRLAPQQDVLLGFQHRQWFLAHQDEYPALKALLGKVYYIDFPGIAVRDVGGFRVVPYCFQGGKRWDGDWSWLDAGFLGFGRVAVARK